MMKRINWIFLVAGTFIMIYVMSATGSSLKMAQTPHGILDLELAYNNSKVHTVIEAWSPANSNDINNIQVAIKNTWLDFIFLFFYSFFLFYTCKTIAEFFTGFIQTLGNILAMGALYAGLLDIAENAGMLITLNGFSNQGIALFTTLFSLTKWFLALAALAYTLLAGLAFLYKRINKT